VFAVCNEDDINIHLVSNKRTKSIVSPNVILLVLMYRCLVPQYTHPFIHRVCVPVIECC